MKSTKFHSRQRNKNRTRFAFAACSSMCVTQGRQCFFSPKNPPEFFMNSEKTHCGGFFHGAISTVSQNSRRHIRIIPRDWPEG